MQYLGVHMKFFYHQIYKENFSFPYALVGSSISGIIAAMLLSAEPIFQNGSANPTRSFGHSLNLTFLQFWQNFAMSKSYILGLSANKKI